MRGCLINMQKHNVLRHISTIILTFAMSMQVSAAPIPADDNAILSLPDSLEANLESGSVPEYVIIKSSDQVTFSSETSASVAKINVKEGSTFQDKEILMELDCRIQKAELAKVKAQQQAASMAFESATKLKSYQAISEFELTQALTQSEAANADFTKLSAIVEKCVIKAPFTGSVAELFVHAAETVKPGDPLMRIVNTVNLDFETQVPSTYLAWLHVGSAFDVYVNEIKQTVKVKVTRINPEIDSVSQTVKIIGNLIKPNTSLLPGMSGQAMFPDMPAKKKGKV